MPNSENTKASWQRIHAHLSGSKEAFIRQLDAIETTQQQQLSNVLSRMSGG